ncbi:MAG TPA: chloride channel protein, partial [Chitinophagaceae bacterium]|nr:chloride channel protein [Chitinophagaceae bacterium]
MKKSNLLIEGAPVSPSLTSILDSENTQTKKTETKKRLLTVSFFAFLIAICVSFIAKLLALLINAFTNLSFFGKFSLSYESPANNTLGPLVIVVPALGGLTVGLIAFYGSKAIRGHGIPEAMEQILTNQSKIKPSVTFLKPLSSAISIGTGGPFGAEGPIIATGGALGSTVGQLIRISHYERKILLAAGATAGMSAIFGSPLAAIFLALELLLFEFSVRSLLPVAIACVTGAAGHHLLFGHGAVFAMPDVAMPSNIALAIYTGIGIFVGLMSVGVSKAIYLVEEMFEKLPVHWMWWPAIGGLIVGLIGYFFPNTLGVGYDNITKVLSGQLQMTLILSLCVFKFFSWAIALGSGTSGGTMAPLLTIGGAMGALMGLLLVTYFPQAKISLPLAALVGMAAMFSGASRALLTSIVFAMETTMQSHALLPLLGACLASYLVSYFLMEHNIMTEKIARRGVKTPHTY